MLVQALKKSNDDLEKAKTWVQFHGFGYSRSHIGMEEEGVPSTVEDDPYWEKAEQYGAEQGLPPKIVWHALKMFGLHDEGVRRTMEFMWSEDGKGE